MINTPKLDELGKKLAEAALTTFVRLCPESRTADPEMLEAACQAMRAKSKAVIDELLDDARGAPWIAEMCFANAALTLAQEGVRVIRNTHAA